MQNFKKQASIATALVFIMISSAIAINIPTTTAADYPTWLFLTVQPDPIGVGQSA